MEEVLSWPELVERFKLPPWGPLDDRWRGKFCPLDETGTPIPPPSLDSEVAGIRSLKEKIDKIKRSRRWAISEIEFKMRTELTANFVKHAERLLAEVKDLEGQLVHYCNQYAMIKTGIGHPFRMWQGYRPSSKEEKDEALSRLRRAFYRVVDRPSVAADENVQRSTTNMEDRGAQISQMSQLTTEEEVRLQVLDMFGNAKSRGKKLKLIIDDLYRLMIEVNKPLKETTREKLKRTAIEIFEDDPKKYDPITIDHLSDSGLYNTDATKTKRDFCGKLVRKILRCEKVKIPDFGKLYSLIWNEHPVD